MDSPYDDSVSDLYYEMLSNVAEQNPKLSWAMVRGVVLRILQQKHGIDLGLL